MSEIIASVYELIEEIGSGGGGVVYLANHLRLNKKVVLKADKRKITTKPELLRREVDILKDLTHSYIPKVFDFFAENETVYTVMDYIEGESLDKVLKRGDKLPQPLVIEWAKQLLEALDYLHTPTHGTPPRGFVHSDIKPANLMRTPFNKICLIDFNIALALGEENVIGCSAGYASPEHYGLDYSNVSDHTGDTTIKLSPTELNESVSASASASSTKKVMPDVRSDIYSAGATLYHLFSGRRPAREATEVTPLESSEVSQQISDIIAKAMNPNPDLRYQTAAEMLYDFEHLHENDIRTKKHKKNCIITAAVLGTTFSLGLFTAFTGLKRMQTTENWLKLAEYATNSVAEGDKVGAVKTALDAFPESRTIFTPDYVPEAQTALTGALGVYDLSDGYKSERTVELPAAPLLMRISPDGKTCACICSGSLVIFDTFSGDIITTLPTDLSDLSEVEYIDENQIVYAGADGLTAYDIANNATLWSAGKATAICVSADGRTVASIYKEQKSAEIYDSADGKLLQTVSFGEKSQKPGADNVLGQKKKNIFALNNDGSLLAVSFGDGSLVIFNLIDSEDGLAIFDETSGFIRYEGGFSGDYFAFSATDSQGSVFAIVDCVNKIQTGGFQSTDIYSTVSDEERIFVQTANLLVDIDPVTGEQFGMVNTSEDISAYAIDREHTLISSDKIFTFFDKNANPLSSFESEYAADFLGLAEKTAVVGSSNSPVVRILRPEDNSSSDVISYDTAYIHDETRMSADEKNIMMFSCYSFRIYDRSGNIVCDVELPDPDLVYDQQYRRENGTSYLEVIYVDGRVLCYSGSDGSLINESYNDVSELGPDERFLTEEFRIESPLHGAPQVYRRDSGELVKELEEGGYLAYVTELDEYFIAHYFTSDGSYCGVLMNKKWETLAVIPHLCDVVNGQVILDYPTGIVRESRIYTIKELIESAHKFIMEEEK